MTHQNRARKEAARDCIIVNWMDDGSYLVGPGHVRASDVTATRSQLFTASRCRSRLAARQAVSRWKVKLNVSLVIGEAILEGR